MLAIIIPYFKFNFFEESLASLANQTDKRFKLYIGDDASSQDPLEVLNKYKTKIDYQYTRFDNNLGSFSLVKQWERCLSLINDENWVMILGDDDIVAPNLVASFYKNYLSFAKKSNVVRFSTVTVFEDLKTKSKAYKQPIWESPYNSYYRRITGLNRSSLSEYIFKITQYKKFGFTDYPLAWHSDDRAWLDFSEELPIYSINESRVNIRMSSINISGRTDNLEKKNISSLLFNAYLVKQKLNKFSKHQRGLIISNYEKSIFRVSKFHAKHIFYLLTYYSKRFDIKAIFRLIKKIIKVGF